jgi:hypothetical protein
MKTLFAKLLSVSLLLSLNGNAATRYVDLGSSSPTPPYTSWATAATNIQDAIDEAVDGDLVLVTNGVYSSGGRVVHGFLTNRLAIMKPVTVQSVNGPAVTIILGNQVPNQSPQFTNGFDSVRCVYLTSFAVLAGFTLTNGGTWRQSTDARDRSGGGAWCETNAAITNCHIIGNAATGGGGGGAYGGLFYNSTIVSNSASLNGGGVISGSLTDCLVSGNTTTAYGGGVAQSSLNGCDLIWNKANSTANLGGGAYGSVLVNSTVISNSARAYGGGVYGCVLTNCTLLRNSVTSQGGGGGASDSTLVDSIVATNSAVQNGGGVLNSILNNCILAGNTAGSFGGGAYISVLSNCILSANIAGSVGGGVAESVLQNCSLLMNRAFNAGGISGGTMNNCLVASNHANNVGGGVYATYGTNCTVVGNTSFSGGGAYLAFLFNSCVFFNTATNGANYLSDNVVMSYSCSDPLPSGSGNIADTPLFLDALNGNYRLMSNSPCINAGGNTVATLGADLDGSPRIVGGTVDIGTYEFQSPASVLSYSWAQQHGLPTDGSADFTDTDGDGMNNWNEYRADTVPTNTLSVLRMVNATNSATGAMVTWQSVSTRNYWLERATNLGIAAPFQVVATNISGATGTRVFTDSSATNGGPYLYRVGVH